MQSGVAHDAASLSGIATILHNNIIFTRQYSIACLRLLLHTLTQVQVQVEAVNGQHVCTQQDVQDTIARELIEAGVCSAQGWRQGMKMDMSTIENPWQLKFHESQLEQYI